MEGFKKCSRRKININEQGPTLLIGLLLGGGGVI